MTSRLTPHLCTETKAPGFQQDWQRQRKTADAILDRFDHQEGVILADQVGMGKTFVALAVAATQVLENRNAQVVILVPPRVAQKWVEEAKGFASDLVSGAELRCVDRPIRSGEAFLKALDDEPGQQDHLVVVTYEALTTTLKDQFVVLALLYFAVQRRKGADEVRQRIARWSEGRHGLISDPRFTPDRVAELLSTPPARWREKWLDLTGEDLGDDPVPRQLIDAAPDLDLQEVWDTVHDLPQRSSSKIAARLKNIREALNDAMQGVWKSLLTVAAVELPLLIVDEAHALKNSATRRSRLLGERIDGSPDGALSDVFSRILLLTATPFELDDRELISVLGRLRAVREPAVPEPLSDRLTVLADSLKKTRSAAVAFENAWSRIEPDALSTFDDWTPGAASPATAPPRIRGAWELANTAVQTRRDLAVELRRWVIRHERPHRRQYLPGALTIPGCTQPGGIAISDEIQLPFLLAARAQALSERTHSGAAQAHFAYGIASSFETFLRLDETARDTDEGTDDAVQAPPTSDLDSPDWYLREITASLESANTRQQHPKITATVARAVELWKNGEKCLVFCWFIRTTSAVQMAILAEVQSTVGALAIEALGGTEQEARKDMERIAERLLSRGSASHRLIEEAINERLLVGTDQDRELANELTQAAISNLRRPENLVRYTHLRDLTPQGLLDGIRGANPIGVDLLSRWADAATRISKLPQEKREALIEHLTGEHSDPNERDGRGASLAPVRRATGQQAREVRERLISVFNTPFAPDVLVASSVMGEGIDLHQECRHVIHHDLDWNPSKLEQRTGRLDRIGALAERIGKDIIVYEPYLAGTHDEKMYRVVKGLFGSESA
ncbi:helicase-related protein [Gordonia phosphorivorans]|uniref:Helicase-related protein n=1 Tax=Gordonia phosphorivorans TaxID=1056982 RepID=A0ABV6HA97_9ACTN